MKNSFLIVLACLLKVTLAYADVPKADVLVNLVNIQTWPAQYTVSLVVPEDHHAYLDAGDEHVYIPVTVDPNAQLAQAGLVIAKLEKPAGEYDSQVKATVLRHQGDFSLWLNQTGGKSVTAQAVTVDLKYQLCNDVTHVCFRPKTAEFDLTLPQAAEPDNQRVNASTAADQSFMERLLALFQHHQSNTLIIFGLMLMAGLLSVATPCVYPMLPITSMFILNRAQGAVNKEWQHASVYWMGMVATYMLLGLIAGMTGGAFNAVMQSAWVNLGFAVFFAFFAIALLGYYELGFMQNEVHSLDQQSARVKGLTGTLMMGSVAGLVISPCVGPIVFALLLQIADNIAAKADALAALNQHLSFWDKFTIAMQGSLMMSGFGLGVGFPFFIISVVKFKKLPKAGYWMNKIKYAFGFAILYFAYTYLEKAMGILGVDTHATLGLAISLVVVWIAVVHCNVLTPLPVNVQPNQKMYHYCGVIALIMGGWLMITSLSQLPVSGAVKANPLLNTAQACQEQSASKAPAITQEEAGILWYRNYAAAQKVAKQTGKPIFIDFYASWCANCVAFKAETANNLELNKTLREKAIAVKLIDQEPEFEAFRENPQYRQLKIGLPYFVILTSDGQLAWSGTDFQASQTIITELNRLAG